MDKEGQDSQSSDVVFKSENIGDKATTEYFSNVKGGRKDKEKVEKKRTRITRKTLFIALGVLAGIVLVTLLVVLIINLVNRGVHGERTDEDLPTTYAEVQERAYKVAYKDMENPGDYKEALKYVNNLIMDMVDTNRDADLIYATRTFRAILAYEAGAHELAVKEAESLEQYATTDAQKYVIYDTLAWIYTQEKNYDVAMDYTSKKDGLDVPENKLESVVEVTEAEAVYDKIPEGTYDGNEE